MAKRAIHRIDGPRRTRQPGLHQHRRQNRQPHVEGEEQIGNQQPAPGEGVENAVDDHQESIGSVRSI